ncbi:MAG: hypothetical protein J0G32_04970 [Alphaproteobacteria bacterium]|nr:hypothetical protein [Alphaproteobacteria bacterium]OJV15787.1 MAG: hypothetical protein BGO27_07725 [Alphaproteobacteria bacterium 33-17]
MSLEQTFLNACLKGDFIEVKRIYDKTPPDQKLHWFSNDNYKTFRLAARSGNIDFIKWVINTSKTLHKFMVTANNCEAIRNLIKHEKIEALDYLVSLKLLTGKDFDSLCNDNFQLLKETLNENNFDITYLLYKNLSQNKKTEFLTTLNYHDLILFNLCIDLEKIFKVDVSSIITQYFNEKIQSKYSEIIEKYCNTSELDIKNFIAAYLDTIIALSKAKKSRVNLLDALNIIEKSNLYSVIENHILPDFPSEIQLKVFEYITDKSESVMASIKETQQIKETNEFRSQMQLRSSNKGCIIS